MDQKYATFKIHGSNLIGLCDKEDLSQIQNMNIIIEGKTSSYPVLVNKTFKCPVRRILIKSEDSDKTLQLGHYLDLRKELIRVAKNQSEMIKFIREEKRGKDTIFIQEYHKLIEIIPLEESINKIEEISQDIIIENGPEFFKQWDMSYLNYIQTAVTFYDKENILFINHSPRKPKNGYSGVSWLNNAWNIILPFGNRIGKVKKIKGEETAARLYDLILVAYDSNIETKWLNFPNDKLRYVNFLKTYYPAMMPTPIEKVKVIHVPTEEDKKKTQLQVEKALKDRHDKENRKSIQQTGFGVKINIPPNIPVLPSHQPSVHNIQKTSTYTYLKFDKGNHPYAEKYPSFNFYQIYDLNQHIPNNEEHKPINVLIFDNITYYIVIPLEIYSNLEKIKAFEILKIQPLAMIKDNRRTISVRAKQLMDVLNWFQLMFFTEYGKITFKMILDLQKEKDDAVVEMERIKTKVNDLIGHIK